MNEILSVILESADKPAWLIANDAAMVFSEFNLMLEEKKKAGDNYVIVDLVAHCAVTDQKITRSQRRAFNWKAKRSGKDWHSSHFRHKSGCMNPEYGSGNDLEWDSPRWRWEDKLNKNLHEIDADLPEECVEPVNIHKLYIDVLNCRNYLEGYDYWVSRDIEHYADSLDSKGKMLNSVREAISSLNDFPKIFEYEIESLSAKRSEIARKIDHYQKEYYLAKANHAILKQKIDELSDTLVAICETFGIESINDEDLFHISCLDSVGDRYDVAIDIVDAYLNGQIPVMSQDNQG